MRRNCAGPMQTCYAGVMQVSSGPFKKKNSIGLVRVPCCLLSIFFDILKNGVNKKLENYGKGLKCLQTLKNGELN